MVTTELGGFPTVEPALIVKLNVTGVNPLGVVHTGQNVTVFELNGGSIRSLEGFEPAVNADIHFGADWLAFDADAKFGRLEVRGLAKASDGQVISFGYNGIIELNQDLWKIFQQQPDAKTIPFGNSSGAWNFKVADPNLKVLENNVWASSARLIVNDDKSLQVEIRISKIVPDQAFD